MTARALSAGKSSPHPAATAAPAGGRPERAIARWLLLCCGMIFVMVVLGGITRLTLSGLSITEWQPVSGVLPPLSAADWAVEFEKYRQIPQYKLINEGMTLADFKTIYWWEYVHRLWGRLIGVAYALPFLYFLLPAAPPKPWEFIKYLTEAAICPKSPLTIPA